MPDKVAVWYPRIGCGKGDTSGVGESSRNQQVQTRSWHAVKQRFNRNHHKPPHQQIKAGGKYGVVGFIECL